jgi:hypothetical protein
VIRLPSLRRLLAAGTVISALALTSATAANASAATTSPAVTSAASLSTSASASATATLNAAGIISSSKPITITETSTSSPTPLSATSAVVTPDTYTSGCSSSQTTWVHLYATNYAFEIDKGTWCVGGLGTTSLPKNSTLWVCTGNNYGSIGYYLIVNGKRVDYSLNFPESDLISFASTVRVTHITINGSNFTYGC